MIALSWETPRATHHTCAPVLAEALGVRDRRILDVVVKIPTDEQVQPPIAIVVAESRARGPCPQRYASLLSHIGERSVMIIVIEAVLPVVSYIDIGPAIVIVISHHHAIAPSVISHSGLGDRKSTRLNSSHANIS